MLVYYLVVNNTGNETGISWIHSFKFKRSECFPQGKSTFVCNPLVAYKFDTNTFTSDRGYFNSITIDVNVGIF